MHFKRLSAAVECPYWTWITVSGLLPAQTTCSVGGTSRCNLPIAAEASVTKLNRSVAHISPPSAARYYDFDANKLIYSHHTVLSIAAKANTLQNGLLYVNNIHDCQLWSVPLLQVSSSTPYDTGQYAALSFSFSLLNYMRRCLKRPPANANGSLIKRCPVQRLDSKSKVCSTVDHEVRDAIMKRRKMVMSNQWTLICVLLGRGYPLWVKASVHVKPKTHSLTNLTWYPLHTDTVVKGSWALGS